MRNTYFKAPYAVVYSRPGPAVPFLDDFAESLHLEGYADRTACSHLRAAAHLGVWMQTEGLACSALDHRRIDAFMAHLSACTCVRGNRGVYRDARAGVRVFLAHLRDRGIVPPAASAGRVLPESVERFQQWMLRHRGVTASTLRPYRPILVELVEKVGDPTHYTAGALRTFVA
ncbi:MAG: phage integrase N-terminal SAM-like domain-containing protein, partial [Chloroflexi bacterium]|nr:phage integrase N-terminal SAM-like domain-containing protein [Chloroflexota bacterium]